VLSFHNLVHALFLLIPTALPLAFFLAASPFSSSLALFSLVLAVILKNN
jgi:hypothetical protein